MVPYPVVRVEAKHDDCTNIRGGSVMANVELEIGLEELEVARRWELLMALASANIFDSTADGITSGVPYFSVPSPVNTEYLILYKNNNGAAAKIDTWPNVKGVVDARNAAQAAAQAAEAEAAELRAYIKTAHRTFTLYEFTPAVVTGQKLLRIAPQLNLKSQEPAIDWVGTADSNGPCTLEFRIINDGVSMSVPVTVVFAGGVATFTVAPHNLYNGDVLEITCTAGSATNLALTARYDIGDAQ